MIATPGHSYLMTIGNGNIMGTWGTDGDDFKFIARQYDQQPIDVVLSRFRAAPESLTAAQKQFVEDLGQPHIFVLSDDGMSLITDKNRGWNGFTSIKLRKQGS